MKKFNIKMKPKFNITLKKQPQNIKIPGRYVKKSGKKLA